MRNTNKSKNTIPPPPPFFSTILEPARTVSVQHGGSFLCLLTEAAPAAPSRYQNPAT